jgi:hexosaminidase
MLFPKMLGMVDRAWNAHPSWFDADAFLNHYSSFNTIATEREMPWLATRGFDFRLPPPGIYIENGLLYANTQIRGAEIRYTTDGSVPTPVSPLWTAPVSCDARRVTARIFYLGHESVSSAFVK